jgi:dolichol-phosphate mannosyltransferase
MRPWRAVPAEPLAIVIPTRNEAANVPLLLPPLLALGLARRIYVMDDASSDGTVEAVEKLAAEHPEVVLVRRTGPRGYGRACAEGLRRALDEGAELCLQMDADLSHDPRYVPDLVAAAAGADLVLGSRYVQGISVVNWSLRRLLLSTWANEYVRALGGLRVSDCTTGFRLWRRPLLERIGLERIHSDGYSFLVETLFRATRAGARVREVPIIFVERKFGQSNLSKRVVLESAWLPWRLLASRIRDRLRRPGSENKKAPRS